MFNLKIRETGTEIAFTLKNGSYSGQQMASSVRLYEVTGCTGGQGLFYDVWSLITAYEEDFRLRGVFPDAASGSDSIQRWKAYIQQNEIRVQFRRFANRFQSI
jgi:hypothetical protein